MTAEFSAKTQPISRTLAKMCMSWSGCTVNLPFSGWDAGDTSTQNQICFFTIKQTDPISFHFSFVAKNVHPKYFPQVDYILRSQGVALSPSSRLQKIQEHYKEGRRRSTITPFFIKKNSNILK